MTKKPLRLMVKTTKRPQSLLFSSSSPVAKHARSDKGSDMGHLYNSAIRTLTKLYRQKNAERSPVIANLNTLRVNKKDTKRLPNYTVLSHLCRRKTITRLEDYTNLTTKVDGASFGFFGTHFDCSSGEKYEDCVLKTGFINYRSLPPSDYQEEVDSEREYQTIHAILEIIGAPLFWRLLPKCAPSVSLVDKTLLETDYVNKSLFQKNIKRSTKEIPNDFPQALRENENVFFIRSSFLPGWRSLAAITEGEITLGSKTDELSRIITLTPDQLEHLLLWNQTHPNDLIDLNLYTGIEKVFAICILSGDYDLHGDNIGYIPIEETIVLPEISGHCRKEFKITRYRAAKIDHGFFGFKSYDSLDVLKASFLDMLKTYRYVKKEENLGTIFSFDFELDKFLSALEQITYLDHDEIFYLLNRPTEQLKSIITHSGTNPKEKSGLETEFLNSLQFEFANPLLGIHDYSKQSGNKTVIFNSFSELRDTLVESLKNNRLLLTEWLNQLKSLPQSIHKHPLQALKDTKSKRKNKPG